MPLIDSLVHIPSEAHSNWWLSLDEEDPQIGDLTGWDTLLEVAHKIERYDANARQEMATRDNLILERDKLNIFNLKVASQRTKQTELTNTIASARARIEAFSQNNAQLIASVSEEQRTITFHRRIQLAYNQYLTFLRSYRAGLPSTLTVGLSETAMRLYNGFNRYDNENDKLAQLRLPSDENQRIEIAYNSHPENFIDALQIMSEGHIRCLGLAILVAKNLQLNCPALIFDDAVNAIDDEHRLGIRDTLFNNQELAEKQILVTCHDEELIKDIEVIIGRRAANENCVAHTFLPHNGDRLIRVIHGTTRNYVLEAQTKISEGRVREAVATSRRLMESINDRTWNLLVRAGHGEVKLKLPRPRTPLDQNNLATALLSNLNKPSFVDQRKERLTQGYTNMLSERQWSIFNVATHETAGIPGFNNEIVRQVIENLAALDDVLSGH